MVEITHGGMWFRWSALDRRSKLLAGASLICCLVAALPFGLAMGGDLHAASYRLGYYIGSGGLRPARIPAPPLQLQPWLAWSVLVLLTLSGVLWWRFSLRQDELFNRIQNWSYGMSGAWTSAVLGGWAVLALAGIVPPVTPGALLLLFCMLFTVFWFAAVRRWA